MGKRSPGPMSYIREASALRNIKLCYAGRSFSICVVIRCLQMTIENVQLTIFKGANSSLAAEIVKTVMHYAH